MARRARAELEPAASPTLLRDRGRRNVFVTFGPWPSIEAVETFRRSDAFREGVAAMEGIVESLEPRTLDEVSRGD